MLKKLLLAASARLCPILVAGFAAGALHAQETPAKSPRELIVSALVAATPDEQKEIVLTFRSTPSPELIGWLEKWKAGEIYLHTAEDGTITPVTLTGSPDASGASKALKILDDSPFNTPDGNPILINPDDVPAADTTSAIRRAMKEVTDLAALADPDPVKRLRAVQDSAIGQNLDKLPGLLGLRATEKDEKIKQALEVSIALIQLKSPDRAEKLAACKTLTELHPLSAQDALKATLKEAEASKDKEFIAAAAAGVKSIEAHISRINAIGTGFRGLSLGSVLLIGAIGLAITFGLMGVINMAHGEFIAIGAYTTYVLQNVFAAGLKLSPFGSPSPSPASTSPTARTPTSSSPFRSASSSPPVPASSSSAPSSSSSTNVRSSRCSPPGASPSSSSSFSNSSSAPTTSRSPAHSGFPATGL